MENLLLDVKKLLESMSKTAEANNFFLYLNQKKNIGPAKHYGNYEMQEKRKRMIKKQKVFDERVYSELDKFDELNIPIIGMKGIFIKDKYYGSDERIFDDIDILIESQNAKPFYQALKKLDYRVQLRTMYDGPTLFMNIMPERYMDNTQTLMLKNRYNKIIIDLHSNLNITNAHFTKSTCKFNTKEFFENSKPFKNYKNIRVLEIHDNVCVLIRHLMKHHVFYGKTQTGLSTPIQNVLDLAYMFNSDEFDADKLFKKSVKYNIVPETLFCINLYNKIFKTGKRIDTHIYIEQLETTNLDFHWERILKVSRKMEIDDLMIGNFEKEFPKLQRAVDFCESLKPAVLNWCIQALVLSTNINLFLK